MNGFDRWGPGLKIAVAVVVAGLWTVYLVASEQAGDDGGFGLTVRIMGSIGILWGLFLVLRPLGGGVADLPAVKAQERRAPEEPSVYEQDAASRRRTIVLVAALAIGSVGYRFSQESYLHQSSIFFVGVPALMAITLSLTPKSKSATGSIVKGLTLALLLSGVMFFEGFVCILMAAPLFYLVGIIVGVPIDRARRRRHSERRVYSIVGAGLLLLSFEGVSSRTTFPQVETVTVTRVVDGSPAEVRARLAATPQFDGELPLYLRLGFPRPRAAYGSGLDRGDTRTIVFGNESPMEPMTSAAGGSHGHHAAAAGGAPFLELEITRSKRGLVVFEPGLDSTAFTHWIAWGPSVVEWEGLGGGRTEVTWTLTYERKLSPAWYFAPLQRYAAGLATGYLVDSVATP